MKFVCYLRLKIAGFEHTSGYANFELEFLDVENIHSMRASLHKMVAAISSPVTEAFLRDLDASAWLKHIAAIRTRI